MDAKFHGYAALLLTGQAGSGLCALAFVSLLIPGSLPNPVFTVAWMAAAFSSGSLFLPRLVLKSYRAHIPPHRRVLGSILLGSSLAAALWQMTGVGETGWLILTGLCVRWFLFGAETVRLRRADRMKQDIPSVATKTRRAITLVTGLFIPLFLLAGAPATPWLWVSFFLTLFCQWTITAECCHGFCSNEIPGKRLLA